MKITVFGDSITNGYGIGAIKSDILQRCIENRRPDIEVKLHGGNGEDTYDAQYRIKYVLAENADLNFVFFGANDASPYHLIRPIEFQENLGKIIDVLGADKTVILTPPFYNEAEPTHYSSLSEVQLFRKAALELAVAKDITCIDIFQAMINYPKPKQLLKADGLHFTEAGYDLLANEIIRYIASSKT